MNLDPEDLDLITEQIRNWDVVGHGVHTLMAFVKEHWAYADWGWSERDTAEGYEYRISTAGWSDNEELMGALQENLLFWALYWQESRRGGHYVFRVPK